MGNSLTVRGSPTEALGKDSMATTSTQGAPVQIQWFQSSETVTASLKLQGSSQHGGITAEFQEDRFCLYVAGEVIWECLLWGRVVPGQCKMLPGRVRVEVKLKKATHTLWPEYQITDQKSTVKNTPEESSNQNNNAEVSIPSSNQIDSSMQSKSTPAVANEVTSIYQLNDLSLGDSDPNPSTIEAELSHNNLTSSKTPQNAPPPVVEKETNPLDKITKTSQTGLTNFGNSCFMSSVIQCLSNTRELRDYFIDGRFLADINKDNPLGFNGELVKCFVQVILKLWSGNYKSFSPRKLRTIISKRSEHFGNYQQQDAHEFMSYLLDGLHEDLNRVKKKPTTPGVEANGRPDIEVANESWAVHKKRNNSFLVERFQGQFKSTLVCPHCSKVSVTFDPFMSLSVPIPRNLRLLPVIFVPADPNTTPIKYTLKLWADGNLELLKASVARKTGIPMLQLRVFEAYNGKFQSLLTSNHPLSSIRDNDVIIVSEVLSPNAVGGDVVEINVIQRVQFPLFPTKCSTCGRLATQLEEGRHISRCGQCKAIGYCDRSCQQKDWSSHKMQCRQGRPVPVGLPFVVSFPFSKLTYSALTRAVEALARRSVYVTDRERPQESASGEDPGQRYSLVPVDRYGDSKDTHQPITEKGDEVVRIGSKFLAMDWRNNPKDPHSVLVTPKQTLDHVVDPSSADMVTPGDGDPTLQQCLELFTQPELLTEDDAWYCSSCQTHRDATKQMSVWRLPRVLILHLKRFKYRNMQWRDKIDQMVKFPLRGLDMSPYMLGDAGKLTAKDTPPLYDLYAVVNHYGAVHIGHYTALVKPPDSAEKDWLCCDDETVYSVKEDKVKTKEAYILFYVCRENSDI